MGLQGTSHCMRPSMALARPCGGENEGTKITAWTECISLESTRAVGRGTVQQGGDMEPCVTFSGRDGILWPFIVGVEGGEGAV